MNERQLMELNRQMMLLRAMQKRDIVREMGIHEGQIPVMEFIHSHPGCSQQTVAEHMMISSASVATSFRRMEKKGILYRQRDAHDTRLYHVFLTEKGEKICSETEDKLRRLDKTAFDGMSEEEKEQLEFCLQKILLNMENEEYDTFLISGR